MNTLLGIRRRQEITRVRQEGGDHEMLGCVFAHEESADLLPPAITVIGMRRQEITRVRQEGGDQEVLGCVSPKRSHLISCLLRPS
jgi:hypothetical protein